MHLWTIPLGVSFPWYKALTQEYPCSCGCPVPTRCLASTHGKSVPPKVLDASISKAGKAGPEQEAGGGSPSLPQGPGQSRPHGLRASPQPAWEPGSLAPGPGLCLAGLVPDKSRRASPWTGNSVKSCYRGNTAPAGRRAGSTAAGGPTAHLSAPPLLSQGCLFWCVGQGPQGAGNYDLLSLSLPLSVTLNPKAACVLISHIRQALTLACPCLVCELNMLLP